MTELQPGATTGAVESCNRRCGCCMGLGDDEDDRRGWGPATRGWKGMGTGDEEDRRGPATRTATGGDKRRGTALLERGMRIQPECSRKKKPGTIRFFFLDPTTHAAHIQRPGLDRPKLSAGAPAPISALFVKVAIKGKEEEFPSCLYAS